MNAGTTRAHQRNRVPKWTHEWVEGRPRWAHERADAIEVILRRHARTMTPITYGELASLVGSSNRGASIFDPLGIVSFRSLMADGYNLSVMVVNEAKRRPGDWFYSWVTLDDDPSNYVVPDEATQWRMYRNEWRRVTEGVFDERWHESTGK